MIVNARTRSVGAETGPDVNKLLVAGAGVACRARLRTCNSELHSSEPRPAAVEFRWRKNSTSGEIQRQPAAAEQQHSVLEGSLHTSVPPPRCSKARWPSSITEVATGASNKERE